MALRNQIWLQTKQSLNQFNSFQNTHIQIGFQFLASKQPKKTY